MQLLLRLFQLGAPQCNEQWLEDTFLHLVEAHFKQTLCVCPATFRYVEESFHCELEQQGTNMQATIKVQKCISVGLYHLMFDWEHCLQRILQISHSAAGR
ncbi:hypothetical protein HPB48_015778 [Haemaphysalis longicornis]|uniref:Uncharacterized protein n=1 Tax=Haemaphysalis longicornis TaxID=44386 RepID=A0A9J6GCH0_HAELO|nr:hypothetical protein HPB48_015778 [Haemaphysalis longicornis]